MARFNFSKLVFTLIVVTSIVELISESASVKSKARTKIIKRKKIIATTEAIITTSTTNEPEVYESVTLRSEPENSQESSAIEPLPEESRLAYTSENEGSVSNVQSTVEVPARHRAPKIYQNCDECFPEDCETPPAVNCPIGLILDSCNCCHICAAVEGNRCYNASLGIPYNPVWGMCGPGLTCQLRSDLSPYEAKEALCECGSKTTVCGSDNKTYLSECKLHEAAHLNPSLGVKNWHPCYSAPTIAQVENVTVGTGDDVSLSCEVRAFPPPVIHWQFLPEDSNTPIILPGDDSSIVVTIRGGPEQIMTTSWIQIVSVTPSRQGVYYCFAKNDEGMTQSSAIVSVYNNNG